VLVNVEPEVEDVLLSLSLQEDLWWMDGQAGRQDGLCFSQGERGSDGTHVKAKQVDGRPRLASEALVERGQTLSLSVLSTRAGHPAWRY
jgi:hypothetical protein